MAGSGANLELIRPIAERFTRELGIPVDVPPSIGTSGAVRAVRDGVVDVGLNSRPLRPAEREIGLVETPLVRVPVAVVAHRRVPTEGIEPEVLCAVVRGEDRRWEDGRPIVVLLREPGDSSNEVFSARLPCFAAALERAYAERRWRICFTDQEMELALIQTPGAIGLLDVGSLALGPARHDARPLRLGNLAVSRDPTEYPFTKDLGFVTYGPPQGDAARFIRFARSAAVRDLLDVGGYALLPMGGSAGED